MNRHSDRLLLTYEYNQFPASRDARVEQISLKHRVMLGHDRNDDGRVFRTLAFMDRHRIGRNECIEFAESVLDYSTVEANAKLARSYIDIIDIADVAVVDLLLLVVLDLHHLVAGRKGPTESLHPPITSRVQC